MSPAAASRVGQQLLALLRSAELAQGDLDDHDALGRAHALVELAIELLEPLSEHLDDVALKAVAS